MVSRRVATLFIFVLSSIKFFELPCPIFHSMVRRVGIGRKRHNFSPLLPALGSNLNKQQHRDDLFKIM